MHKCIQKFAEIKTSPSRFAKQLKQRIIGIKIE